jgi:hypothetical protein
MFGWEIDINIIENGLRWHRISSSVYSSPDVSEPRRSDFKNKFLTW